MRILVEQSVVKRLISFAIEAHPHEACGILLGMQGAILQALPARNVHHAPETHFEIDPQALIDAHRSAREGGPKVMGYYHSHPVGAAMPSETDRAMASGDGRVWAIIAEGEVRFWRDNPSGFDALSYQLTAG